MEDRFKKTEYYLYKYKDIDKLNQLADIKIKRLLNDVSIGGGDMFGEKSSPTNKFNSAVENEVIKRYFSKPTREWTSIAAELNQSVDNCIKVRRKVIEKLSDYIL